MRVLVTGGAGYIGSHTFCELLKAGHDVTVIDNLSNSSETVFRNLKRIHSKEGVFLKADICIASRLETIFKQIRPDAIIHFAGLKSVGNSVAYPLSYYENNVSGSLTLLNAMDNAGCNNIIFSSSATVYGKPESLPISEDHQLAPVNPYGRTKLFIEEMITDWCSANSEKSAVLLRYFNPTGAHPSGEIGESPNGVPNNLMPFISQVAAGKQKILSIYGEDYDTVDGTGVRDYIHVCDLASGHVAALDYCLKRKGVDVFNLGTGRGYSVLEMVKAFERASGQSVPYNFMPRREGDIATCYADVKKAKTILNWEARLGIGDMCTDSWRWQKRYPNGYSDK